MSLGRRRRRLAIVLVLVPAVGIAGLWMLMIQMPGRSHEGPLPALNDVERALSERLSRGVRHLAGDIGERNVWRPEALQAASTFIQQQLAHAGYALRLQEIVSAGHRVENIEAERPGTTARDEIVVVGAHYDSVLGSPGANDNGTGVAALLELASAFRTSSPERTLRFVAFANEEPPFFQTPDMGSLHYAREARERGDRIVAMISIETIGAYSDAPDSQQYPLPVFGVFYPREANFIAFVSDLGSHALVRRAIRTFRDAAAFPSEGTAAPGWIDGVGWSDHWAFWQHGYPAIMVTDTALFRYPHYHTAEDTPAKVDYERMARVVSGLQAVIAEVAGVAAR